MLEEMGNHPAMETGELGGPLREAGTGWELGVVSIVSLGGNPALGPVLLLSRPQLRPAYSLTATLLTCASGPSIGVHRSRICVQMSQQAVQAV